MSFTRFNPLSTLIYCSALVLQFGCATWLPSGEEPAAPKGMPGFGSAMVANDAAGVETILVRLNASQASRLPELWAQIDEQALKPELRIAMDKNGMRAGKISGSSPPLLDEWVRQTVQRIGEDPMEQAGFAADVSSFSQLWRCRADVRKELSIRNFQEENLCVFYHDVVSKGHIYEAPHFQYAIQATPHGDASATIHLTPEMQHGELVKKMIARESAVRTDTRRESVAWKQLSIDLRIQKGDYIVIGPTVESRCLGEHFFHTKTQKGEVQPVLLLVRLSEANSDSAFSKPSAAQVPPTTFLR
jgi:hypothetical protein